MLDGIRAGKPAHTQLAVLDNKACAFVPRVQTLTVGQTLELRNSDPILHDAHALLPSFDTLFNLGLPEWRQVRHTMQETGRIVVDCNVLHTWMRAYLIVTEHPYTAVTDAAGRFSLDQVPAGEYTLQLWHERLGEMVQAVSVGENQELSLTLEYDEKNDKR
jgi:plastocyanin